jgi:hypothetical protein
VAGSRPKFLYRRSQIFYFCCRGDLGHFSQHLNLGFSASLTNILLFLQGRFGARLPESGPSFQRRRLQKFFSFCRGDLERVCRNLDLVFTADAHKYSSLVAGAIWSVFARIWTWVLEATLTNICCKYGMELDGWV